MPHRPEGRSVYRVAFTRRDGSRVTRSTGTRDPKLARAMDAMLDELGGRASQAWDVLDALADGTWDVPTCYAEWLAVGRSPHRLRERLHDTVLAPLVEPFLVSIGNRVALDTVQHYRVHLTALVATIRRRSDFTVGNVEAWLGGLSGSAGTVRKYAAAASGFASWLVRRGVLPFNPVRDVPKPSPATPRDRWLTTEDAQRLADAQVEPYRTFSALLASTGLDVSAALAVRKRDVDLGDWTITRVRPKTGTPHVVLVAEWGRVYLERHIRTLMPESPLFGFDRWMAEKRHKWACAALGIVGFWQRDHRHSWAVRWAKAGGSAVTGAAQLGHTDGGVLFLRVYGHHYPPLSDRQQVESDASVRDIRKAGG